MKVKFLYVVFTMMLLVAPTAMAQSSAGRGRRASGSLPAHSSRTVNFNKSGTFKLKIKATSSYGQSSYHDGGKFSVTSTETEWTEGEMVFKMSTYGSGLGPSISAKEFESNE